MPKWMETYFKKDNSGNLMPHGDVDFSELTAKQQKTLFLAHKLKTKGSVPSCTTKASVTPVSVLALSSIIIKYFAALNDA